MQDTTSADERLPQSAVDAPAQPAAENPAAAPNAAHAAVPPAANQPAGPRPQAPAPGDTGLRWLLLMLAGALALRVILATHTAGYLYDTNTFTAWAAHLAEVGPGRFYADGYFADYPPGYMYVLWAAGSLCRALGLAPLSPAALLALCAVPILCDLGIAALLWRAALPALGGGGALTVAAFAAFNPAFLFDCAVWKQVDAVPALLLLACFLLLARRKYLPAALCYGLALLVKPLALLYGPPLALAFLVPVFAAPNGRARGRALLRAAAGAAAAAGCVLALSLPFVHRDLAAWLVDKYAGTASSYPYASINAFNAVALLGGNWQPLSGRFLFFSWQTWGWLAVALLTAGLAAVGALAHRRGRFDPVLLAALYGCGVFTFAHSMHERYVFAAVVLLLGAWAGGRRRLAGPAALYSAVLLANMMTVQYNVGGDEFLQGRAAQLVLRLTSLACVLAFVWLAAVSLPQLLDTAPPQAPAPAGDNKRVYRAPVRLGNGYHLVRRRELPLPRWSRRDTLALALLTVFAAALSLPYLGTTRVPQKAADFAGGETLTLRFDAAAQVASVWAYPGIAEGALTVSDGTGSCQFDLNYGTCFSWQVQDVSLAGKTLTVTLPRGAVEELVFVGADGAVLTPQTDAAAAALFDEQSTLPERPSQLNGMYFDEIYHGRTGYETLNGLPIYETTHPPLGKDLIALGIALFGMNPIGWRIMGVLFGIAMVPVFYLLARRLLRRFDLTLTMTALFALDFMRYTQSRLATIDVFVVFFVLLGAYFMLWYCQVFIAGGRRGALLPAALGGMAFGLGCAAKWTGVYAGVGLAAVYFLALAARKKALAESELPESRQRAEFAADLRFAAAAGVGCYVLLPLALYVASYLPLLFEKSGGYTFSTILSAQRVMFEYHSQLKATHPFESRWYTWPLMLRPVWYYMGSRLPAGTVASIAAFGNPVVWWGGLAGVLALLGFAAAGRSRRSDVFVLLLYAAQYLPWALISRATFIYHYFAAMIFALLALGLALQRLLERRPLLGSGVCAGAVVLAAGLFAFFFPVLSGLPVSTTWAAMLKWLPGWGFYIL